MDISKQYLSFEGRDLRVMQGVQDQLKGALEFMCDLIQNISDLEVYVGLHFSGAPSSMGLEGAVDGYVKYEDGTWFAEFYDNNSDEPAEGEYNSLDEVVDAIYSVIEEAGGVKTLGVGQY